MELPDFQYVITDDARPYLVLQKGNLWHLKDDSAAWEAGYNRSMNNTYRTIRQHLPEKCESVLDVGSGMGGINALINWHYGGDVKTELLDGVNDTPVVTTHTKTFSNFVAAQRFLQANGVKYVDYIDPVAAQRMDLFQKRTSHTLKKDLIISFGAWCFHFPPEMYISYARACCKPGTVLMLDVRNDQTDWYDHLVHTFGPGEIVRTAEKFTKYKFIHG